MILIHTFTLCFSVLLLCYASLCLFFVLLLDASHLRSVILNNFLCFSYTLLLIFKISFSLTFHFYFHASASHLLSALAFENPEFTVSPLGFRSEGRSKSEGLYHAGGVHRLHGCIRWSLITRIRAWRASGLPGPWTVGGLSEGWA